MGDICLYGMEVSFMIRLTVLVTFLIACNARLYCRINADVNDLPWEFTVETFPSIIFFPARR